MAKKNPSKMPRRKAYVSAGSEGLYVVIRENPIESTRIKVDRKTAIEMARMLLQYLPEK